MPKLIFTLLLGILGFSSVYASFPVTENENITEISLSIEDPDIEKNDKRLWFIIGLLGTIYGLALSMIYQLVTQKKGPIKYAFYGLLSTIAVIILILVAVAWEGGFNPFIFS